MKKSLAFIICSLFFLLSCSKSNDGQQSQNNNGPTPGPFAWEKFCMGADLSYVNELEDYGAVYQDSGVLKDPFAIMKSHGANTVRVRLWYNPQWVGLLTGGKLYSDLYDVEKTIRRAKDLGMAVNLDFHYSDEWADPGNQVTPAAWTGLTFSVLKDSVYAYTSYVLNYLKIKSLTPEMVQIGNETNSGMLWPSGKVENNNWAPFGELLNEGIRAVRDFSATSSIKPQIILHVAQLQNAEYWVTQVINNAHVTDFDILGISHYSKWSAVNDMASITALIRKLGTLTQKKVMIVETAYPWTGQDADSYANIFGPYDYFQGYPPTQENQLRYLKDLTQAVVSGGGKGIMYWEPAWITTSMHDKWGTGSPWDNCTLFDFTGHSLPGMQYMLSPYQF